MSTSQLFICYDFTMLSIPIIFRIIDLCINYDQNFIQFILLYSFLSVFDFILKQSTCRSWVHFPIPLWLSSISLTDTRQEIVKVDVIVCFVQSIQNIDKLRWEVLIKNFSYRKTIGFSYSIIDEWIRFEVLYFVAMSVYWTFHWLTASISS